MSDGDGNVCDVNTKNIDAARAAALTALAAKGTSLASKAWDHKTTPARLDIVEKRLGLTKAEREALMTRGFVVLEKYRFVHYAEAFHEIFQSELPLWVSLDSILHAIYRTNDNMIERIEGTDLRTKLNATLESLHCALPLAAAGRYSDQTARDVDLYLTVARSLLAGKAVPSVFGVDGEAQKLVARANAAEGIEEVKVFGRPRMVDFSVYLPRGHYAAKSPTDDGKPSPNDLSSYFRAATWLSRFEFNLVTRDCASSSKASKEQTPREELVALALADLARKANAIDSLNALDTAWATLAGRREDVGFVQLGAIASEGKIDDLRAGDAAERLRKTIGTRFSRTARTHFTWEGCSQLPVIATMLGARIVPDSAVTRPLVHSEVLDRQRLGAMDMAYAFGHSRATTHMAKDLAQYPTLQAALGKARTLAMAPLTGEDLYSAWFGAIRALSTEPTGELPSFMRTDAYRDLRINSTVAAFGQIRHNFVLFAAMTYGEAGCQIPDAYVEPSPAVLDSLIQYASRGEQAMKALGKNDEDTEYFRRLGQTLGVLRAIASNEVAGRALPDEALRFLSMVVESRFGSRGTGSSPSFTGWYFDLFKTPDEALEQAAFLADYYTSSELSEASYAGVKGVRLGVFVVDAGGSPRVVVGPVADAFEAHEKLPRLTDAMVYKAHHEAPWAKSYTEVAKADPPLAIYAKVSGATETQSDTVVVRAWSTRALGKVTIALLDHHRRPVATKTLEVGTKPVEFRFPGKKLPKGTFPDTPEGIHVQVGEWHAWETGEMSLLFGHAPLFAVDEIGRGWGGMKAPPSKELKQATGE